MLKRKLVLAAGLAATLGLGGCWDAPEVTLHDGTYKGKNDPLLSQQVATRTEALHKRFQLVQADR